MFEPSARQHLGPCKKKLSPKSASCERTVQNLHSPENALSLMSCVHGHHQKNVTPWHHLHVCIGKCNQSCIIVVMSQGIVVIHGLQFLPCWPWGKQLQWRCHVSKWLPQTWLRDTSGLGSYLNEVTVMLPKHIAINSKTYQQKVVLFQLYN